MEQRQLLYSAVLLVLRHRLAGAPREPSRAGRPSWHTYFVETTFRLRKRNRFGYMPSSLSTRTDRLRNDGRGAARRSTAAICARRAWACAMCKKSYPVRWVKGGGGGLCAADARRMSWDKKTSKLHRSTYMLHSYNVIIIRIFIAF